MQYAGAIQRGIRSMRINGVDETELCFHATQWGHTDYEFNPQCTENGNRIFHAAGGGISFQKGMDDWYDQSSTPPDAKSWVISARYEVTDVGTDSATAGTVAGNADLILATGPVKEAVCEALNSLLGHTPKTPPLVGASTYDTMAGNKFLGAFSNGGGRIAGLGRERCVAQDNGSGDPAFYYYYKVILAR